MGSPDTTQVPIHRNPTPAARGSDPPWAVVASVVPASAALLTRMRAIDLAYHVKTGLLSLRTGDLVRTDPYTFTHGGLPWLNQQWGAQLIFAWAHRLLGWTGVAMTFAAAMGSGFGFLYGSCRRAGALPRTAAVLTLAGFIVTTGPGPRPQVLAIPLFTGTWLLLARRDRWTWLIPALALIWANVHGSFVLAPLLVVFALGDDLIERRPVGRTMGLLCATVAATFVTPFGPSVWPYAADIAGNDTIRHWVAEWRAPSPLSVSGGPFWLSGVVVAAVAVRRRRMVSPIDAARLVVFFALGAPALRGILWWALAMPPIVAGWYPAPDRGLREPARRRRDPLAVGVGVAVIALLPMGLLLRAGTDPVTGAPERLAADAPQVLVDAIRRALPAGSHLLVYQPFASWFEYSYSVDPVMVDSRIELFSDAVWHDYDRAIAAADSWDRILDRYEIRGVVLPPDAVLAEELSTADGWRPVADGLAGSAYVRD